MTTTPTYTGEYEPVAELTAAQQAQQAAQVWREKANRDERGVYLNRVSHIAQVLRDVAADLDSLGELELTGSAMLALTIQIFGEHQVTAAEQIALVDRIAAALGQSASRKTLPDGSAGHYGTGHADLAVVTTARHEQVTA